MLWIPLKKEKIYGHCHWKHIPLFYVSMLICITMKLFGFRRWEFIKERFEEKKKENTISTQKQVRLKKKENTLSKEKNERKQELGQEKK